MNAALVPESDPNVTLINDKIIQFKENVEKTSAERTRFIQEFKKVSDQRTSKFLDFFDNVAK